MRSHVRALHLCLALALGLILSGAGNVAVASNGWVDCAEQPGHTISGTLHANVRISTDNTICFVTGTINGNVLVTNDGSTCGPPPPVTALALLGTVNGNVRSEGGPCVMVWLLDGGQVTGNITFGSGGNLGFLAEEAGSTVGGNVVLQNGLLWATGDATDNRIDGSLICAGGELLGGSGSGSATDWDGVDADQDGTIGRHMLNC